MRSRGGLTSPHAHHSDAYHLEPLTLLFLQARRGVCGYEARDQYGALLPVGERVQGAEHPDTLTTRNQLARWTGVAGDAAGPPTSTPPCCPSTSGSWALSTPVP
jgi:hypothetical protein